MLTKFAGLLCLLLALGAIFYLWSQALKDRSKPSGGQALPSEPVSEPERASRLRSYSLTPEATQDAVKLPEAPREEEASWSDGARMAPETKVAPVLHDPAEDELAKTHLEIAHQFFQLSDFEGAADMARLVIDNADASANQKDVAHRLHLECT